MILAYITFDDYRFINPFNPKRYVFIITFQDQKFKKIHKINK